MSLTQKTLFIFFSLIISMLPLMLSANTIPWRQHSSFQFVQEISLPELIRGYFALQSINVVVAENVQGSINGKFEDLSPEEFLNRLSRSNGLIWFYDGNVVHVNLDQDVVSKFITINDLASKKLLETISGLGMIAPSSSIRLVGPNNIAFVSGPPKYVEILEDMADRLSRALETDYKEVPKVRVFPLQHAWAYDTTFTTQETRITLPGLATILRGLMQTNVEVDTDVVSGAIKTDRIQVADKLKTFNQGNGLLREHKKEIIAQNDFNPAILPPTPPLFSTGATLIQPDIRLNAIIVRDVEEKMPQYEAIIKALDVPVYLIEISVAIMDINSNFSSTIGNALFHAQDLTNQNKFIDISPSKNIGDVTGAPFNIQVSAITNGWQILSRIEALATDGYANILARPTVVTLNNLEAEISNSRTFYVTLIGTDASDLAAVTVGTILKVTPRVIDEVDGSKRIKLMISLEDGTFDASVTANKVSSLPITNNNVIHTQAVVIEGQSLFIGGYYRQEKDVSETGIPVLKDIPLLGYLFKERAKNNIILERMYLITPRVVYVDFEKPPIVTAQICDDFTPPPMGIAHEMSKENYECTHECPYAEGFDCGQPKFLPCTETPKTCNYTKIRNYFD